MKVSGAQQIFRYVFILAKDSPPPPSPQLFSCNSQITVDNLSEKSALTALYYVNIILFKGMEFSHEKLTTIRTRKGRLLHDDARPHNAKATVSYLLEQNVQVLTHKSYNSDLASCNFQHFSMLKQWLAGQKFSWIKDLLKALISELVALPHPSIEIWLRWMKLCVEREGEYFEGMWKYQVDMTIPDVLQFSCY